MGMNEDGGSHWPLSRPVFFYVSHQSLERPEVREFVRFDIATAKDAAVASGYVPIDDSTYARNQARLMAILAAIRSS